ncbi:MAG: protein-glutamate O-methyltransferase CheR [Dethiobacter sp.]|nr:protein-glutamate O-methyltransferase CheR [Dethiobacter sp.]MCL5981454.1 protein-glutamate O-methyltransferase CheR [Bacillota bacterium]
MSQALDYEYFKKKVKDKVGLDLGSYKEQQMKRRIHQLMQRYKAEDYADFLVALDREPAILQHFTDYLTINTSQFFRDVHVYQAIEKTLLPTLLREGEPLKIWSAGCSIGAEPYSLAMLLLEMAPAGRWQILATDFDVNILAKAREGRYADNLLNCLPERFMRRYFTERNGHFYLDEQVKRVVTFRQQNLLTDCFEAGCQLILCRNVFIYFTPETQELLINGFAQSLKPGGYFIIGCSELISSPPRFGLQKVQPAIYRKV